jgi:uncharacterized membrane protein
VEGKETFGNSLRAKIATKNVLKVLDSPATHASQLGDETRSVRSTTSRSLKIKDLKPIPTKVVKNEISETTPRKTEIKHSALNNFINSRNTSEKFNCTDIKVISFDNTF